MKFLTGLLLLVALEGYGQSEKTIQITPRPSWVIEKSFIDQVKDTANTSGGYYTLLYDDQFNAILRQSFHHYSQKVLSERGLESISTISALYDPAYETLTFHSIDIIRNGKRINQLELGRFEILRRETSMDRLIYDGNLTAIFNLHDVQVGDVLEYSFSYQGSNPVFQNKFSKILYFNYSIPVREIFVRLIVESSRKLEFKKFNDAPDYKSGRIGNNVTYEWSLSEIPALQGEESTPGWFDPYQHVQITEFGTWADLSRWADNLFRMEHVPRDLLSRVPGAKKTIDEATIKSIIRFVQDEVRYLSFSEGIHGFKPHPPETILRQRFGDCKDKSVLLATLLRELGLRSHAVLVNTGYGKSLDDYLPSPTLFNHCIVQFEYRDSVYWVDPTMTFQRGPLKALAFPRYYNGMVISSDTKSLTAMPASKGSAIVSHENFYLDSIGGGATLYVTTTYGRQDANNSREYFKSNSLEEIESQYLNFYATDYPYIVKTSNIKWTDNEEENIFTVEENYKISGFWLYDSALRKYDASVYPRNLATYLVKPTTRIRKNPYGIRFPLDVDQRISIYMPEEWTVTPGTKKIESSAFSYFSESSYRDRTIDLRFEYHSKKSFLDNQEIREYITKIDAALEDMNFTVTYTLPKAGGRSSSTLMLITLLASALAAVFFGIRYLFKFDPMPDPVFDQFSSIGGWLILPAIGICVSPLKMFYDLFSADYFSYPYANFFDPTLTSYNPSLGIFILSELLINIIFLSYAIFFGVMFFKRRSSVPFLAAGFYGFNLLLQAGDSIVGTYFDQPFDGETFSTLFRALLGVVIWIPYFIMSERSKGTFTVRHPDNDSGKDSFGLATSSSYP